MKQFLCEYYYDGDESVTFRTRYVADTADEVRGALDPDGNLAHFRVAAEDEWADQETGPRELETQDSITGGTFFFTEEPDPETLAPEIADEMLDGIRRELTEKPQSFDALLGKVAPDIYQLTEEHYGFSWALSWLEVKKELVRTKEGYRKTITTKAANDQPRRSSKGNSLGVLQGNGGHGSTHDAF